MLAAHRLLARRKRSGRVPEGSEQLDLLLSCARSPSEAVTEAQPQGLGKRPRAGKKKGKPLCARSPAGLELHAAVHVRAGDRSGLERLCRYIARPPVPEQRLSLLPAPVNHLPSRTSEQPSGGAAVCEV